MRGGASGGGGLGLGPQEVPQGRVGRRTQGSSLRLESDGSLPKLVCLFRPPPSRPLTSAGPTLAEWSLLERGPWRTRGTWNAERVLKDRGGPRERRGS